MNYSLTTHNKNYQISIKDAFVSVATGFSGAPYAYRHYELGHRFIALIEALPLLGGMAALIERIAHALFGSRYSQVSWHEGKFSVADAGAYMRNGFLEAVREHRAPAYASYTEVDGSKPRSHDSLTFKVDSSEDIGPRPSMEDAKFVKETAEYLLAGVFDGHGGSSVSRYAAEEFEKRFPVALKECDTPCHAFEKVFHEIQQEIAKTSWWNGMGSTAVVTYVDKSTNTVYTATIGDSEANIYRSFGWRIWSKIKSVPLSVVRDWTDQSERGRLEAAHGKDRVNAHFKLVQGMAKGVRSQLDHGVNVARALGDVNETGTPSTPLVIHRPKITETHIQKGDVLVLACDGLKDYVAEKQIVEIVKSKPEKLAGELVKTAIHSMPERGGDNVTVITIQC